MPSIKQYADLDFQSVSKLLNLPAPTSAGDAATKGYVDNAIIIEIDPLIEFLQAKGSTIKAHTQILDGFDGNGGITSGKIYCSLFSLRKAITITTVTMLNLLGGNYTPSNTNGVAIYSISGTNLVKEAEGLNANFFQSTNNAEISVNLTSPLTLQAGLYVFAYLYHASAAANVPRPYQLLSTVNSEQSTLFYENFHVPYLSTVSGSATSFPATIAISNLIRNKRAGYARFY